MLRKIVRSLPPVANRDAQIRRLKSELRSARAAQAEAAAAAESAAEVEAAAQQSEPAPSFHYKLHETRRIRALVEATGRAAPVWDVNDKASGYRFAESHGVRTPAKYGHYDSPQDIDWASLPEMFVIKTVKGTTSLGVIPVQRVGEGRYQDLLSRNKDEYTTEQMVDRLDRMVQARTVSNELYLEELLLPPQGTDLSVVPDVKLYAFYGEIGMVMVSGRRFRGPAGVTFRFFDAEGTD
ncbi:ATP-grasp fold amidoligase family protein, partial [Georgenia sp. 10Sc9-8]|nr:ATP-grasp fold amidoligase family protein [Georgenia halotolerans]